MALDWRAAKGRNLPLPTGHAMLTSQKTRDAAGGSASRIPALEPGIGWDLSEYQHEI
jgi:hypothetical protein